MYLLKTAASTSIIFVIAFVFNVPVIAGTPSKAPAVIIINNQAKSRSYTDMPAPIFTHASHEKIYKCSVCHPKLFIKKIGANKINMRDNMNGKYCGKCHDGMNASSMAVCDTCHRKP